MGGAIAGFGLASGDTTKAYANLGKWYFQSGASYVEHKSFRLSNDFKPN